MWPPPSRVNDPILSSTHSWSITYSDWCVCTTRYYAIDRLVGYSTVHIWSCLPVNGISISWAARTPPIRILAVGNWSWQSRDDAGAGRRCSASTGPGPGISIRNCATKETSRPYLYRWDSPMEQYRFINNLISQAVRKKLRLYRAGKNISTLLLFNLH
jgi:hypothetical protein